MKHWITTFGSNELLLNMVEYLSSKDICKLFLLGKSHMCMTYEDIIYTIYYKLYLQLHPTLNISIKNINLISQLTRLIIESGHMLKYYSDTNSEIFTTEEITIRKIFFQKINNSDYVVSLYYIFYELGLYSILSRLIADNIIISQYEHAISAHNYYGNEETLRMALRFKNHNMTKQILYDMKTISDINNLELFWFMDFNNNVLFESITNYDFYGFSIMLDNICLSQSKNFIKFIILESSDTKSQSFSNLAINNNIFHIDTNILIYALKKDMSRIFNIWDWEMQKPHNLNIGDFSIYTSLFIDTDSLLTRDRFSIYISERFQNYINYQYNQIVTNIERNYDSMNYINKLNYYLNESNINIFDTFNSNKNNKYLLLMLLTQKNRYLFMIIFLIIEKNKQKFDINYIYKNSDHNTFEYGSYYYLKKMNNYSIINIIEQILFNGARMYQNNELDFRYTVGLLLTLKYLRSL